MAKKKTAPSRQKKNTKPTKTALRSERAKVQIQHAGHGFTHKHYVFIAKLKRGEIWALNQLTFPAKQLVTPLLEMWPPNPPTPKKAGKSLPQQISDLIAYVNTEWTGLPCYLDTQYLLSEGVSSPAAVQAVFSAARAPGTNVLAIPVTSPFFGPQFQEAIRNVIATDGRGVMFRIPSDFFSTPQNIPALENLAAILGAAKNQVDILIDLAYQPDFLGVQQIGAFCLNSLPTIDEWRTVTLASGCFPNSISNQPINEWLPFDRSDWRGWNSILGQRQKAHVRLPSYGDYGVRCGGKPAVIPNSPAPNLRYTDGEIIWVRKTKDLGTMQAICTDLINQSYFRGADFSQGDSDIAAKAATINHANGSPEQWIQWCTNHHMELTVSQIQSRLDP